MKKYIIAFAAAAIMASGAMAQNAEKKTVYTPEAGDWALGFDVVPLLRTIGSCFNEDISEEGIGASPMTYDNMLAKPNVSIIGKYMLTDKWGLKANLGLTLRHDNERSYTADDFGLFLDPNSGSKVVDSRRYTTSGGSLTFGAEYRLGHRRVQGVFGFGILAGFSTSEVRYSYGNAITSVNRQPSSAIDPAGLVPAGYRVLHERTDAPNFVVGGYASAGVECFVAPKIAIGAEVDLYVYGGCSGKGYITSEGWNNAYNGVEERTDLVSPGNTQARFGTDNIGGSLYMTFYF